jgi:hypothetical protein
MIGGADKSIAIILPSTSNPVLGAIAGNGSGIQREPSINQFAKKSGREL